jgi:large subunit ribosomal protein L27
VKLSDGSTAKPGAIIVRQRGTKIEAGKNVRVGKDHTLYAVADCKVSFRTRRKTSLTGHPMTKKVVDVI